MDQVTEEIAHFIGLFHTTIEQGRLRQDYTEFKAVQAAEAPPPEPGVVNVSFRSSYTLNDPEPELRYIPFSAEVVGAAAHTHVGHTPPYVPIPTSLLGGIQPFLPPGGISASTQTVIVEYVIAPPGAFATYASQDNRLYDDDYVSVGGSGFFLSPITAAAQAMTLAALFDEATGTMPLLPAGLPGDGGEIADFVESAIDSLKDSVSGLVAGNDLVKGDGHGSDIAVTAFVAESGTALEGLYVNGAHQDELPKLSDYLPEGSPLADGSDDSGLEGPANQGVNGPSVSASGEPADGGGIIDPSVRLDAGGNTLVNTVALTNAALDGAVFAVAQDHVELNAVVQVNAWSDSDSIGRSLLEALTKPIETTVAFNLAQFERIDPGADGGTSTDAAHAPFPQYWAVTEITGDLIFINWSQQFNFVMDRDVHVMASSGVTTTVTTGENLAFNDISIHDLGNYYDLVLVGGSLYDANLVLQTNVMLDDDLVGTVHGFQASGEMQFSTSGNLLWNQASITNVGGAGRFEALTNDYRAALDNCATGTNDMPEGVLHDEAFAGLSLLRVLYVSGNVCDLQYVSQTNVLGDGDEVALAMNEAAAVAGADWTVSTGSNVLVNSASIFDLDTTGKTYVGGEQYSDELLIQSDIIRTDQVAGARDADALVNEAVVFLGDGLLGADHLNSYGDIGDAGAAQPAYHDIMQTVVS